MCMCARELNPLVLTGLSSSLTFACNVSVYLSLFVCVGHSLPKPLYSTSESRDAGEETMEQETVVPYSTYD